MFVLFVGDLFFFMLMDHMMISLPILSDDYHAWSYDISGRVVIRRAWPNYCNRLHFID